MTQNATKPWSQVDDEQEVSAAEIAPGMTCAEGEQADSPQEASPRSDSDRKATAKMAMSPLWALAPLAIAAGWMVYGVFQTAGSLSHVPTLFGMGLLALVIAAGTILVFSRFARKAALADLNQAIQQNMRRRSTDLRNLPVGGEIRPVWNVLEHHLANVENRVGEVLEDRKRLTMEIGLLEAKKRHAELIVDSIPDPVLVTDAFDQLVLANPSAADLFGFSPDDALRKPITQVVRDEDIVRMISETRAADSRAAKRNFDHEIGSRVYSVTLAPMGAGDGNENKADGEHGVVATFRDVTKARQVAKAKSDFVSHVSHELRTPLSSIRAYVEMLVDGEVNDEATRKEYYNIIETSADRLGRLIDNLLNISRIEAGTVRINKEPVPVAMVVKEATDMMRPQAAEKGVALTEELMPVVYLIEADRDMIYQSVMNLLSNAVKYTPKGGKVHVRMVPDEKNHAMKIEVSDTGVGIPEEDLPNMFKKFFRVEANKKMAKGTGLGLNLVKHIVETVHHGQMTLDSEVGKGSTFGMVLPLVE